MKLKFKAIFTALALALTLGLSLIPAAAEEADAALFEAADPTAVGESEPNEGGNNAAGASGETVNENGSTAEADGGTHTNEPGASTQESSAPDAEASGTDADMAVSNVSEGTGGDAGASEKDKTNISEDNTLSRIGAIISEHAPTATSLLAAIVSLVIALSYKTGLLPMLRDALGTMGSALAKLKESASEESEQAKKISEALEARLEAAESGIDKLESLGEKLCSREGKEGDVLKVMSEQVELLYDVFMQSSLPEYKKERIGERIAAMRASLSNEEEKNEA